MLYYLVDIVIIFSTEDYTIMKEMSKRQTALRFVKDFLLLSLGAFIYSCAVALFLTPVGTLNGGASGLAIIMNHLIPKVGTGTWIFIVNIPLLVLCVWKLGPLFSVKTIISVGLTSVFTELLTPIPGQIEMLKTMGILPAAILGGIFAGAGIGFAFKAGSCQGGSDIVVKVLRLKFRALKSGSLFLIIDGCVVCLGGLIFQSLDALVYAVIIVFIQSKITDLILYGQDGAKMVFIITDKQAEISSRITKELHSGVTYLSGKGAYTGNDKQILMCAMRKQQLPQAKDIVKEEDHGAFMISTSANQVWGVGYTSFDAKEL